MSCAFVGTITNGWHDVDTLETSTNTIVNTTRFTPVRLEESMMMRIRREENEHLRADGSNDHSDGERISSCAFSGFFLWPKVVIWSMSMPSLSRVRSEMNENSHFVFFLLFNQIRKKNQNSISIRSRSFIRIEQEFPMFTLVLQASKWFFLRSAAWKNKTKLKITNSMLGSFCFVIVVAVVVVDRHYRDHHDCHH